ncbi:MAG TPA: hypothetical protein VNW94_23610 [Streptosporangiaceae bacterium]|nr:hypothetical protein [Streptosporangiaceae bacterium]
MAGTQFELVPVHLDTATSAQQLREAVRLLLTVLGSGGFSSARPASGGTVE